MGSCLLRFSAASKTSSVDSSKVLFPSQGSTLSAGPIRIGGDYNFNSVWDMGGTYYVKIYYFMHPDNYSTQYLDYSTNNSSYTQFATASKGANVISNYTCTARYIRNRNTVDGTGSALLNIFAVKLS